MLKPQDQTASIHISTSKSAISSHPSLSNLSKSKGFLIENPDGTLIQGIFFLFFSKIRVKCLKNDSVRPLDLTKNNEESNINLAVNNNNNNNSGLIPIFPDEDFAFFAPNQEIPEFVDELITLFLKHSKFFYVILFVQMALDITFNVLTYVYKTDTLKEMSKIYEEMYDKDLKIIFWSFFLSIFHKIFLCLIS